MDNDEKNKKNTMNESGYIYVTLFKRTTQSIRSPPFKFAQHGG